MIAIYILRRVRWFCLPAAIIFAMLPMPVCHADDESLTGVSGTIELLWPNPSIRMVEEHVDIEDVTAPHVTARFVFTNEGPATNVLIGFPEMGDQIEPGKPESPGLDNFRSFVDGKPIAVTRRMARSKPRSLSEFDYVAWYLKRVLILGQASFALNEESWSDNRLADVQAFRRWYPESFIGDEFSETDEFFRRAFVLLDTFLVSALVILAIYFIRTRLVRSTQKPTEQDKPSWPPAPRA
jgi:hypothetical protein